ncbi:hypothetical protein GCM10009777_32840 [Microbacterium pumilum]|uniref:Uncharacterized protein n=1 Tax=Microbacterium pumilum TaxID=344165 RepID=A0ABN2SYY8_9MICO
MLSGHADWGAARRSLQGEVALWVTCQGIAMPLEGLECEIWNISSDSDPHEPRNCTGFGGSADIDLRPKTASDM